MDTTPEEETSNTARRLPTPPWKSSIVGLAMAAKAEIARISVTRSSSTDPDGSYSMAEDAPEASSSSTQRGNNGPVVISLPAHSDSVESNERQTSENEDDSDVEMDGAPRRKRRATATTTAVPTILEAAIASGREHLLRSSRLKTSVPAKPPQPQPARKRTRTTTGVRSTPTVKASAKSTTKFRGKEEDDDMPAGVFPCGADRCKMNFARWSDRQRHVRSQHMGITYHCPVVGCKRHYNRRDAIVRHLVHRGPRSGHGMTQTGAYNLCKGLKADWDGRKLTKEQLDELDDEDMSDRESE
ncbi:hypothetical protein CYLTODRAFT_108732 [Cylindrobasidium torrendii FP15055 ss-10]|uniref:C2H2-type domain-containing protein n=1 Tax=Cylindrobasidium torrendii FP15055 ss-10 TaxID=1314674 RepID=A0A0D7B3Y1_9AGAR|nr:hypothetical protein CYLTODRAFT_108732 [Cylindrobasidium torrendii FP15055 ss-10]